MGAKDLMRHKVPLKYPNIPPIWLVDVEKADKKSNQNMRSTPCQNVA